MAKVAAQQQVQLGLREHVAAHFIITEETADLMVEAVADRVTTEVVALVALQL
jgi:hypothetical protein